MNMSLVKLKKLIQKIISNKIQAEKDYEHEERPDLAEIFQSIAVPNGKKSGKSQK